jgi:hypothetical protein
LTGISFEKSKSTAGEPIKIAVWGRVAKFGTVLYSVSLSMLSHLRRK